MWFLALALAWSAPAPYPMAVETHQDAITDRISARAVLHGDEGRLEIGCGRTGGDIEVEVHSDRWLVRGALFHGHRNFIYRFDQHRPVRKLWIPEERSARLVMNRRVVPFLRALVGADRLVVRMEDVEKNMFDTAFAIAGARPALDQLFAICARPDLARRVFGEA